MNAIFKREFKSYFISLTGFLFCAALLFFTGVFATQFHLKNGHAGFELTLQSACNILLFIVPILTMRSLAEDKRAKTDRLLYSLPLSTWQIVLGKYFAMLAVLAVPTLVIALYPLILSAFGSVNFGAAYACLLAFFLLGAALIALCLFLSSLAETQVMAAILGFGASFLIYILRTISTMLPATPSVSLLCFAVLGLLLGLIAWHLTKNMVATVGAAAIIILPVAIIYAIDSALFQNFFPSLLSKMALFNRFETFAYGLFDISAIVLYLSFAVFFVALTAHAVEKKRWS